MPRTLAIRNRRPKREEIQVLSKIAKKYGLPEKPYEDLCFALILDSMIEKKKRRFSELKKKRSISVVDVGSGYFRYGKALHAVLSRINPNIKLFAVDREDLGFDYKPAEFIQTDIGKIFLHIDNADIVTVFNPYPGIPDLPRQLTEYSILLGCVDWNPDNFKASLDKNGYKAVHWEENRYKDLMREWFNNYNPFVLAVPK